MFVARHRKINLLLLNSATVLGALRPPGTDIKPVIDVLVEAVHHSNSMIDPINQNHSE